MQKKLDFRIAFLAVFLLSGLVSGGQVLTPDIPVNSCFNTLQRQYGQGQYALAAASARQYLNDASSGPINIAGALDLDKAKYMLAQSCLKTNIPGARDSAIAAMEETPDPAYSQMLAFALAQYYFVHDAFNKAIPLYLSAGTANLSDKEIADEKFELAYCYFNNSQFDKAEPLFVAIKELKDSKYYIAANYYYGLLVYNKNKYKEALQSFDRVKDYKEYRAVVPYYIAELYYFMGNRDRAMLLADTLIRRTDKSYYDKELHLLEGQCLFEEKKYKEALPYFDFYYHHADKVRKQDLYEMAYCSYKTGDWAGAAEKFRQLGNASDSLGQTSMYLLGDCYLKTGNKAGARNAFGLCADMTFNTGQQEAAMILYARISYETGYDDDALRQLNDLLVKFPGTSYKDEANTLISDLLVKTNDYAGALQHLKDVGRKDHNYRLIYQKAAYGYAVQAFRNGQPDSAQMYFTLSLEHPANMDYEKATYFWESEIAARQHRYKDVLSRAQDFLSSKGDWMAAERLSPMATPQHALLNMGYAAMALENYSDAQDYFDRAQRENTGDRYTGKVAAIRQADAVFMQKNYPKAISLYDRVIATDTANADYARYQKAILLGLEGKTNEKITLLQTIIHGVPPSGYANHARYEIAVSLLETDKYPQALAYLHQLTDSVSDKSFAPQAWMKTGFIWQQTGENVKAIAAYKHVVTDYPASEDRLPALDALRSLFIQGNQPAAYTRLLKENNLPSADSGSIDSTFYAAAEAQFSNGKWEDARTGFDNYLHEYPNGIFSIKARYYRAESNYQLKKYKDAQADYVWILGGPWNDFFENSARRAGSIAYDAHDYKEAYSFYTQLRNSATTDQTRDLAYDGLMKSGYNAGMYKETALYADSVLARQGAPEETKNAALYFKARSLQQTGSNDSAITIYQQLANNRNGAVAAESRYRVAEILFNQAKLKDAETAANNTIHLSAGYDYWIVKSYLLLADLLVKQNDYFNAKATLTSITRHTKIDELKKEAEQKLDEVNKLEKKHSKVSEE